MPNKTIYIRDSDISIWEKAQKELGGTSLSSILTDCLKQRLTQSEKVDIAQAMKNFLADLNSETGLDLELHPSWSPVILDPNSLDVGYKIHRKGASPDRIISLVMDPFNFALDGNLNMAAKAQTENTIREFWSSNRSDPHLYIRVGCVDIKSRLLSLVGKKGLLKTTQGEFGFTFEAVHPSNNLPSTGDDEDLQRAISNSEFTVKFDDGVKIDDSDRKVISGLYISLIRGRY